MSQWGYRVCAGCNSELASECYSVNQWRKQVGVSRCKLCIQENVSRDGCGFGTGRSNENSRRAQFDFCRVFATGSFRVCYRGVYTGGPRTGQSAIAKVFKDKYEHMSDLYFAKDEETINMQCILFPNLMVPISLTVQFASMYHQNGLQTGGRCSWNLLSKTMKSSTATVVG